MDETKARQVLEPCPFCGSAHVDVVMFETHHNEMWHRAECQNCMAKSSGSKYPALAIAAWNRRAAPDRAAIVEECAQVAELVCKANFMERGGLLVDKVVPRIRALKNSAGEERDHG